MKIFEKIRNLSWQEWGLLIFIIIYSAFFLTVFSLKYHANLFNELDTAIFQQTLFQLGSGNGFENAIQQQNYLGDHFAPLLIFLTPIYAISSHSLTLIVLQFLGILAAAYAVYKIADHLFDHESIHWPAIMTIVFLLNFTVTGMLLFGFHMLPFVLFPFLWGYYKYLTNDLKGYYVWLAVAMFIREDVSLLILFWSMIPFVEKRSYKWWAIPAGVAALYFITAMMITQSYSVVEQYKFLSYYQWLGNSWHEIIWGILSQPLSVLRHLLSFSNIEFMIGLAMPFLFLAFGAGRFLLPLAALFLMYGLQEHGASLLILQAHYGVGFVLFALIATLHVVQRLRTKFPQYEILLASLLIVAAAYSSFMLGPFTSWVYTSENSEINTFIKSVNPAAGIVAPANLLPRLANREQVYSLHYVFMGHKQFSSIPYEIPDSVEYVILSSEAFQFYDYQAQSQTIFTQPHQKGSGRITQLIQENNFAPIAYYGDYVVYQKDAPQVVPYIEVTQQVEQNENHTIFISNVQTESCFEKTCVAITMNTQNKIDYSVSDRYYLTVYLKNGQEIVQPLGGGIFPPNEWQQETGIIQRIPVNNEVVNVEITQNNGYAHVNRWGSIVTETVQKKVIHRYDI
jgi:uncharacterized membrane protein